MANDERQRTLDFFEPDDQRARRACAGKVRFPSKKNASARARVLAADYRDAHWNSYKCPRCRCWHVGHDRWLRASDL